MFEWEGYFQPHILERGWKYAKSGAVTDLKKKGEQISAIVRGTEYYRVDLIYSNSKLSEGYCTCPYASDGSWCKHMAAVLYAVDYENDLPSEEIGEDDESYSDDHELTPIESLIEKASRKDIENLLIRLANSDPRTESEIRTFLGKDESFKVVEIKTEIDDIFDIYSDWHGYIDYNNAFEFESALSMLLKNRISALIANKQYMDAFDASMYAYVKLGNQDIDDDGEIISLSRTCYELWQEITDQCSPKEKSAIKAWFEEHAYDGTVIDYMEETLKEFLKYELASEEELKETVKKLEEIVDKSKGSNKCRCVFSTYYGYDIEAIELRNILVKRLGATDEEIDKYRKQYMSFKTVRDYFINKAREDGDTEEEIKLLKASKKYDKESSYLLHEYAARLIDIYKAQNNKQLEKAERKEDVYTNQNASIEDIKAYHEMCGVKEWKEERLKLIESRKFIDKKCELLIEEKMFEQLFDVIWAQKDKLSLINRYGFLLPEKYSGLILDFYSQFVSGLVAGARSRSAYEGVIRYLMRMSKYKGGAETAKKLALDWIGRYHTRKVLVQELRDLMGHVCLE